MYEARTQETILAELKSLYANEETLIESTFGYDIMSANAIEFAKLETEIAEAYSNSFGHTAAMEYLELRAAESGVYRKEGKKAVGELAIIGTGTVYAGAIFATAVGTRFVATETVEIDGTGTVEIEAEKAGASGNVAAGTINRIPLSIAGIRSCTNPEPTIDGYDEEDDETLRERYLEKVRNPGVSGNPREYVEWACSVVGVGTVRCQRCWNGAGTVKVVVADSNLDEANVLLLQRVYDYIQQERPVGAEVSVVSARIVPINIEAKITGSVDIDAFTKGVTAYFTKLVKNTTIDYSNVKSYESFSEAGYISLAQINSYLIAEGGADDVQELTLNGKAENFPLQIEEIPKLGTIDFY